MLADIDLLVTIRATPERIWTCFTQPALVEQWLGCIGFEARIGALFYMQPDPERQARGDLTGATHCEVELLEPPRRMRFSWFIPGLPKTHVEMSISDSGDGSCTIRLVHDGWGQFDPDQIRGIRDGLAGGWGGFVLPGLKRVAEAHA